MNILYIFREFGYIWISFTCYNQFLFRCFFPPLANGILSVISLFLKQIFEKGEQNERR